MRLYTVHVVNDFVVWADSEEAASAVALQNERGERDHARVEAVAALADPTPETLPPGWDTGCIPWGRDDDVTIGEILGCTEFVRAARIEPEAAGE